MIFFKAPLADFELQRAGAYSITTTLKPYIPCLELYPENLVEVSG